jgi:hypothetical protein
MYATRGEESIGVTRPAQRPADELVELLEVEINRLEGLLGSLAERLDPVLMGPRGGPEVESKNPPEQVLPQLLDSIRREKHRVTRVNAAIQDLIERLAV